MENKAKTFLKNIVYTFTSNFASFVINALVVLFIPKVIGVEEYGYFQLYTLLATYALYFHLGWCDGIYLRNVGKKYEELDKSDLSAQFRGICLMSVTFFVILISVVFLFVDDTSKAWVYLMASAAVLLVTPKTYTSVVVQSVNHMKHYSGILIAEKCVYAAILIVMLLCGVRDFRILITADVAGKVAAVCIGIYYCRDIISTAVHKSERKNYISEAKKNISVGFFLLLSNISSVMITGIVQLSVETKWSIATFSKVSLTFNMSKLLMVVVNAVGVVLIPMLKNTDSKKMAELYRSMRSVLMAVLGLMLVFYYPIKVIMSYWLPQYAESLRYMALLFPMCLFESKTSMLLNTYLKAMREEKKLCAVNVIVVVLSGAVSGITVFLMGNLNAAIIAIPYLLAVRALILEFYVGKKLGLKLMTGAVAEIILASCFIVFSWNINSWLTMAAYLAVYLIYAFYNRNYLRSAVTMFMSKLRGKAAQQ